MYYCVNLCVFVLFFEIIAICLRYCYFFRKPQSCLDLDIYQATNFQDPSRLRRLAELVWSNQFSNHFVAREPKHQPKRSKTLSGGRFQDIPPLRLLLFFWDIAIFEICFFLILLFVWDIAVFFEMKSYFFEILLLSTSAKLQISRTPPDFAVSPS